MDQMATCGYCGTPGAQFKCSNYCSVSYCNSYCQEDHHKVHKKLCSSPSNDGAKSSPKQDSATMAPSPAPEDNFASPSKMCIARIHADIKALKRDPLEGIFVDPDENRVNVCHAIVLGPSDTPYEFGFFYFLLEFPDQYPCVPPRVTLKTTGGGRTRFNPNLYGDGKVCLSILGTWSGPSWSPAQNIGSVLLSIRSLMNSNPYFNEPGFENKPVQESRAYNHIIRHETLRIAILDNVELATKSDFLPKQLAAVVQSSFVDFAELYKYVCDEYSFLDGQTYSDPLHPNSGVFKFAAMKARIEQLAKDMEVKDKNVAFQSTADESYAATGGVIKH